MDNLTITTNNHWNNLIDYNQLTEKEQKELDCASEEDSFFRYKGNIYALSEFMAITSAYNPFPKNWQGYSSDSAFSGVLIEIDNEYGDQYKVATYYS